MIKTQCDKKGRLYLREALRNRYGQTFIIQPADKQLILTPIPEDPVADLQEMGQVLPSDTIQTIKAKARELAKREASQ